MNRVVIRDGVLFVTALIKRFGKALNVLTDAAHNRQHRGTAPGTFGRHNLALALVYRPMSRFSRGFYVRHAWQAGGRRGLSVRSSASRPQRPPLCRA